MAQTFIYAIYCPNKQEIKIGYASNPVTRLLQLQTGTTDRLDLLITFAGGIAEEKELHTLLSDYRLTGEWFVYNSVVLSTLDKYYKKFLPIPKQSSTSDVSILDTAYKFEKLFTVSDLRKLLPSLTLPTKEIAEILLNNGYILKTYPSSRMKYYLKPKS